MIARRDRHRAPHVLMIGNNAAPTDRRLWLECVALRETGIQVSVVCPELRTTAPGASSSGTDRAHPDRIDGIDVYRYPRPVPSGDGMSFVRNFAGAWWQTLRLTCTIWRRHRFDVIQACNPPDTYFAIALLFRLFGVRFVFDQHDLSPEIFRDRFADGSPRTHRLLLILERMTHRAADQVLTVNESCRQLLLSRTTTPPDRLTVVRTGPDLARLRPVDPDPRLRNGRAYLCAYLGVMGLQDGVELILHAVRELVYEHGREDVQFVLMGDGDRLAALEELSRTLAVQPWVQFTGWADDETISGVLSTADLGLQPDRSTPFTDLCSMLKTVEYMAFGLPVVAFDLVETRRSARRAASYVESETPQDFAARIVALLDDPARRRDMSACAHRRAHTELAWDAQRQIYLDVVRTVLDETTPSTPIRAIPLVGQTGGRT